MVDKRCRWCGRRDGDVVFNGAVVSHEACDIEAERRMSNKLCSMCGRPLPSPDCEACGRADCVVRGYPPA